MRLLLCILLASVVANAQQRTQLFGSVLDATGGALPDAAITVLNLDTGIRRATRSNPQGVWAVYSLQPGEYKVRVRKVGFRTLARVGVRLGATESARLDFLLELGPIQETVTVEGAPVLTNTNDATALIVLGRDAFATLPLNGRGLQGVLDLAPGVVLTPATAGEAGQFSAAGQRPNTNYFTVDGVGANTGVSGAGLPGLFSGGTLPGMTAIGSLHSMAAARDLEEVRVQTSTFAPDLAACRARRWPLSRAPGRTTSTGTSRPPSATRP
ncbi:MAG: carboxypeptidase regulatory-like domain-containing protein [Bryobacterales bacterium]|nr:carboxypeptidase regulatory-like domain-containing protein [Bryobacterales bacterium]